MTSSNRSDAEPDPSLEVETWPAPARVWGMTGFQDARAAVARGPDTETAARELLAAMTPAERLWCLDGDAPTWAGLGFLGEGGYHKAPFRAAHVDRLGVPGFAFSDGPRGVVIGNGTCFPVSM